MCYVVLRECLRLPGAEVMNRTGRDGVLAVPCILSILCHAPVRAVVMRVGGVGRDEAGGAAHLHLD